MAEENLTRNITVNINTSGDVRAISALARLEQAQASVLRATNSAANSTKTLSTTMKSANDNSGRFRAGLQNVGYQAQDTAVQIAGGTSAVRALSQQLPQAIGALGTMFEASSKLGAFFGGPWGVALGVAVAAVVPLATALFDLGNDADKTSTKLADMVNTYIQGMQTVSKMQEIIDTATSKRISLLQNEARIRREQAAAEAEGRTSYASSILGGAGGGSAMTVGGGRSTQTVKDYNAELARNSEELRKNNAEVQRAMDKGDIIAKQKEWITSHTEKDTAAKTANTSATVANTRAVQENASAQEEYLRTVNTFGDQKTTLPIENQLDAWQQQNQITQDQIASLGSLNQTIEDFTGGAWQRYVDSQNAFWSQDGAGGKAAVDVINGIGDAFGDAAAGTKSFGDAFEDMGKLVVKTLVELAAKWAIMQALTAIFGPSDFLSGVSKKLLGSADGNVFSGGTLIPMAKGGIVTTPTLFPMANGAGLMGEAGPEAVMPLQRTADGRLGVSASPANINIYNNSNANVTATQDGDNVSIYIEQAKKAVAADIARGDGIVSSAIQNTYKLGRGK